MLAATYAAPAAWAPAAAHDESLRGESTAGVGAAVVGVVPSGEAEPSGEAGDAPVASGGGDGWDFGGPRTVARVSAISRCFAAQEQPCLGRAGPYCECSACAALPPKPEWINLMRCALQTLCR